MGYPAVQQILQGLQYAHEQSRMFSPQFQGGGGTGAGGAAEGAGGSDRMAGWQPFPYIDQGEDPNRGDYGVYTEPWSFWQNPTSYMSHKMFGGPAGVTPRDVERIYQRQAIELQPSLFTPGGVDYGLARTRAEESLRQKRDFMNDARSNMIIPTPGEITNANKKVGKYQKAKRGK